MRCSLAAVLLLLATSAKPAGEPPAVPTHFVARIGGFLGSRYSVELKDRTLTYTASGRGQTNVRHATITPTETAWREFRQALDDLKVWGWQNDYPRGSVLDGTQWLLEIAYRDRTLKSRGDNNYPDAAGKPTGKPESTAVFDRCLEAIKKLIDGRDFS
ncbi:MAG TPA: hypothetical protein VGW57_16785 [Chthoniobacterales bacterium]|nr:hypothetical protein [Chthoniobacterales bacterium]